MATIRPVQRTHCMHGPLKLATKKQPSQAAKRLPTHLFTKAQMHSLVEKGVVVERPGNVKELHTALLTNEVARARELFSKTLELDDETQDDLTSLYHNLKSDSRAKLASESFKKLYCEHTIKQSALLSDHEILQSPLAEQCRDMTRDELIETLDSMENPKAKRLASEIAAISNISFSRHKLAPMDMLEVCIAAEDTMSNLSNKTKTVYKRPDELKTIRGCVLDPVHNRFTILSKSHGKLDAQGAFKRVSDAVEVTLKKTSANARSVAHVRNRADEHIPSSELRYEFEFGQVIGWTRYNSKNRPYEKKTLMLQEMYDHDLYIFTEFTSEKHRKKISLEDMVNVLEDAGKTLLEMHEKGIVHRDVKAKNILYKKDENGVAHGKLIDFGHCHVPEESTYLRKRTKGYGTLRYTAPELLEKPSMKGDILALSKAEDAYSLGQCIFEVYFQQATPWGSITYRALKKTKNSEENRATAIRLQKETAAWAAKEAKNAPESAERELVRIMARLLEPNPKKRMKIPEFMKAITELKSYMQK